jgi:uncharacterized protein
VRITWDAAKNRANQKKHGVSFQEARALLLSGNDYLEIFDEEHSDIEDRFLAIGPITRGLLVVAWTERDENTVRIISARLATRREQTLYRIYKERMR